MSTRNFAPVYPLSLSLDEAVVLEQLAGIRPEQLVTSMQMLDGELPPASHVGALLYIAARRADPAATPEDISGMTWPEAIDACADVLERGRREQAERDADGITDDETEAPTD